MFEDAGSKIKKIAIVLFWIAVVASVILAFVFGWSEHYSSYSYRAYKEFEPALFFSFLIGGPLCSYISTLFLVAFGDLVENTQRIKELNEKIATEKGSAAENPLRTKEANGKITLAEDDIPISYVRQAGNTTGWKCQCGRTNADYVSTCVCGRSKRDNQ